MELESPILPCTKLTKSGSKTRTLELKPLDYFWVGREHKGKRLHDIEFCSDFLGHEGKSTHKHTKINLKICMSSDTITKMGGNPYLMGRKYLQIIYLIRVLYLET